MRSLKLWLPLFAGLLLAPMIACDSETNVSGGSGGGGAAGAGGAGGDPQCTASLRYLQKDAYSDTAGRSSELWPPHTTTTLEVVCGSETVSSSFRANHGTEPDDVDANGDIFLVDVGGVEVSGPRSELLALASTYDSCECATKFLSMDALQDEAVQQVVGAITNYVADNLTCTGNVDANGIAMLLSEGNIDGVLAELGNCTWAGGSDWSGGFDEALQSIIMAAQETLADYHVCNNDAIIQGQLMDDYAKTGVVGSCAISSLACSSPAWFFTP